jgi:hypothetical protein
VRLALSASALLYRHLPAFDGLLGDEDAFEHWGKDEEIHERRIELRTTSREDDVARNLGGPSGPVAARVRDGVERVRDGDDARGQWNPASFELARVSASVPSLVMREHSLWELGIEGLQRSEYVGAALRMRQYFAVFRRGEPPTVVNDVEQRLVDLPDVVEECDLFDDALLVVVEPRGVSKNKRIRGDSPDMCAGLCVIGVDGVEERLECCGGEALSCFSTTTFIFE